MQVIADHTAKHSHLQIPKFCFLGCDVFATALYEQALPTIRCPCWEGQSLHGAVFFVYVGVGSVLR